MNTPSASSNSKRRRFAWIIGVVVIIGVGALVVGNWKSLYVQYHTDHMVHHIETGVTAFLVMTGTPQYIYSPEARESIDALKELRFEVVPQIVKLLGHNNPAVQCAAVEILMANQGCPKDISEQAMSIYRELTSQPKLMLRIDAILKEAKKKK